MKLLQRGKKVSTSLSNAILGAAIVRSGLHAKREAPPGLQMPVGGARPTFPLPSFSGSACEVGLWKDPYPNLTGDMPETVEWTGRPFQGIHYDTCFNIIDLSAALENDISAFKVAGNCECSFYDQRDCTGDLFSAQNREDMDLHWIPEGVKDKVNTGDQISSFRCRPPDELRSIVGQVALNNRTAIPDDSGGDGIASGDWTLVFDKTQFDKCKRLGEAVAGKVRGYYVIGPSCLFYDDDDCEGAVVMVAGGSDRVMADDLNPSLGDRIRSFKCFDPYQLRVHTKDTHVLIN